MQNKYQPITKTLPILKIKMYTFPLFIFLFSNFMFCIYEIQQNFYVFKYFY